MENPKAAKPKPYRADTAVEHYARRDACMEKIMQLAANQAIDQQVRLDALLVIRDEVAKQVRSARIILQRKAKPVRDHEWIVAHRIMWDRQVKAMKMREAGNTWRKIGEELNIGPSRAAQMAQEAHYRITHGLTPEILERRHLNESNDQSQETSA